MNNVIIADDSDTARMFVRRCFEIAGLAEANIMEAPNGYEVLKILRTKEVDLVITDLNMPELDGRSLLKEMRSDVRWSVIPVIIVSSAANAELQSELKLLGAQAVVKKPPSPEQASQCLRVLSRRGAHV